MKAFCFFSLLVSTVLLSSCAQFIPVSKFAKGQELLGISKELFLAQYGMPYSQDAYYTPDSVMEERLFYIERLYNGDWHVLTTRFTFRDSILVKQEMYKDQSIYDTYKSNEKKE
ncbi:MAG TPA: hypothetical protein DHW31_04880 [Bacteroides graminisolvens]|uniref:Lipoprotein n=1 Tax=Bacteroides graminisolvens TaxID=477666 RepID=A0A3D2SCX6_9BACE|nr:hypothetical protein [Bacteroides graminisolvens]